MPPPTARHPREKSNIGPTLHRVILADAREMPELRDSSVHLVVTSPPYANLKQYQPGNPNQLGDIQDYEEFLDELDKVFRESYRMLLPGGRICCVVGDVNIARQKAGRHFQLPLSSDIRVRARRIGFDVVQGITWLKVANIKLEASDSSRFLGKPNLPNGIIKNDTEHIIFMRKPGYRIRQPPKWSDNRSSRRTSTPGGSSPYGATYQEPAGQITQPHFRLNSRPG